MNTRIIDTADAVVRRYKTRNPEEIISQRAIKLKDIRFCHDLLGYYTVMLNCEYIGINQIVQMPSVYLLWLMSWVTHFSTGSTLVPVRHFRIPIFTAWTTPRQNGGQTSSPQSCSCRMMMFLNRLVTTNSMLIGFIWKGICRPTAPLLTAL